MRLIFQEVGYNSSVLDARNNYNLLLEKLDAHGFSLGSIADFKLCMFRLWLEIRKRKLDNS